MGIIGCTPIKTEDHSTQENEKSQKTTNSRVAASTLKSESLLSRYPQGKEIAVDLLNIIAKKMERHAIPSIALVYRASEHRFKAADFHEICNGKKNTVLIACTTTNRYFGAFTSCEWKRDEMFSYQEDQKGQSFIFKIYDNNLSIYDLKEDRRKFAVMNDNDCGPVFGEGHDINIVDEADRKESWNNLGHSYKCEYKFGSIKANSELAGDEKYRLSEYEIWEIRNE